MAFVALTGTDGILLLRWSSPEEQRFKSTPRPAASPTDHFNSNFSSPAPTVCVTPLHVKWIHFLRPGGRDKQYGGSCRATCGHTEPKPSSCCTLGPSSDTWTSPRFYSKSSSTLKKHACIAPVQLALQCRQVNKCPKLSKAAERELSKRRVRNTLLFSASSCSKTGRRTLANALTAAQEPDEVSLGLS